MNNEELMGAIPNGSRILIRLPEPEKKTSGGIIIPEMTQKDINDGKKTVGTIEAFGKDVSATELIKCGRKVVFSPIGKIDLTIADRKYAVIDESDIILFCVDKK